jgi:maleylpyruvate isomerase
MELSDEALYEPAAIDGLSRAYVVARLSCGAQHQALEALDNNMVPELPEELP